MKQKFNITFTKEDLIDLLQDETADRFTMSVTIDGNIPEYTIFKQTSSTIGMRNDEWKPMTEIQKDCEPIIRAACAACGVFFEDVLTTCRNQRLATARKIMMYEIVRRMGYKYTREQIGKMLCRDHSLVTYHYKNFKDWCRYDRELRLLYDEYLAELEQIEKERRMI